MHKIKEEIILPKEIIDKENLDIYFNEANKYINGKKEYEKAIKIYNKIIEINPEYAEAYYGKAVAYHNKKEYEKAIKINPEYAEAYYGKAVAYHDKKEYEKAIENYEKAIKINPEYAEAYYGKAVIYHNKKEYEKAIENYEKAIKINPEYAEAYYGKAVAYHNKKEYEKAIENYEKAINKNENYVEAYYWQAVIYNNKKEYEKAIKNYNKITKINPEYAQGYYGKAVTYHDKKEYEKAIENYEKAINKNENYVEAYYWQAVIYSNNRDYEKAIKNYEKAIAIKENYKDTYEKLFEIYNIMKNNEMKNKYGKKINHFFVEQEDTNFFSYINNLNLDEILRDKINLLFKVIIELKDKMHHKLSENQLCHYTKLKNLKYLVNSDIKETKLRLNNAVYMNDPTEGEIFISVLRNQFKENEDLNECLDKLYKTSEKNGDREILDGKKSVFLASFSETVDSLPMWVQYSDNGNGCCLLLNNELFDLVDKNASRHLSINSKFNKQEMEKCNNNENYYCLYDVNYNNDNFIKDNNILIDNICEKIVDLKEDLNKVEIKEIVLNLLDQVRFLFKDESYKHEKEVRLVKFADDKDIRYTTDAEGFEVPHIYIEMEKELKVDEVILGPKVEKSLEVANYIYYTKKVNAVSKSKIKYR